jgi:hypothetical protein
MAVSSNITQLSPCPVCQNVFFKKVFNKKGKEFWRCADRGLEKIYPLPTPAELKNYYDESYTKGMYKIFIEAQEMKRLTAKERLKQISAYIPQGKWLNIGCSDGVFVEQARLTGIQAEGIDLSEVAIQEAHKRNLPVYYSTIEDFNLCLSLNDFQTYPRENLKPVNSSLYWGNDGHRAVLRISSID